MVGQAASGNCSLSARNRSGKWTPLSARSGKATSGTVGHGSDGNRSRSLPTRSGSEIDGTPTPLRWGSEPGATQGS
eukprot:6058230-Prymnesium_polylepis.1